MRQKWRCCVPRGLATLPEMNLKGAGYSSAGISAINSTFCLAKPRQLWLYNFASFPVRNRLSEAISLLVASRF